MTTPSYILQLCLELQYIKLSNNYEVDLVSLKSVMEIVKLLKSGKHTKDSEKYIRRKKYKNRRETCEVNKNNWKYKVTKYKQKKQKNTYPQNIFMNNYNQNLIAQDFLILNIQ